MAKIGEKLWKNRLLMMGFILVPKGCRTEAVTPLKLCEFGPCGGVKAYGRNCSRAL
jgi:hypothetical protein